MATREALREFQNRLTQRMQEARATQVSASWLAVQLGGLNGLFPLSQAGEIFPFTDCEPVPYTQPWFLGVVNLRGGLHGVVHLAAFLGRGQPELPHGDAARKAARLVALNEGLQVNCALLIDRLVGLRGAEAFVSSEAAPPGGAAWLGRRHVDAAGLRWQEIDLQGLAQQADFLSIAA